MDTLGISFGEKDAEYVAKSFCQNAEGRVTKSGPSLVGGLGGLKPPQH